MRPLPDLGRTSQEWEAYDGTDASCYEVRPERTNLRAASREKLTAATHKLPDIANEALRLRATEDAAAALRAELFLTRRAPPKTDVGQVEA